MGILMGIQMGIQNTQKTPTWSNTNRCKWYI